MKALEQLGMEKNWIYETIISSMGNNTPHAAPFGVKTKDDEFIEVEIYKGSHSLKNILANSEFAVNMVVDPIIFYNALFAKEKLRYSLPKKIDTPVLNGSPASIEVSVIDTLTTKQRVTIKAKVVHVQLHDKIEWINRAKNLLFESLVIATRIPHYPEGSAEALLRENHRVVRKVAPDSEYELIMQALLKRCFDFDRHARW
jgi:hypothetical protein